MVVTTKMNSAPLPPLRPDSEQLVDLHVYQVPEEVWNLKYRSAYNEVINETISIGFVRVWPELSIWNLRTELLNQLGPDCVPGEFVYVRSVGRCLTKVKGRQELELKVKAFLPPRNFAPEIFILEAPQDVPDTALIEASKQETATREDEGASSMEIDGENDKDEETNVEKDLRLRKLAYNLQQRFPATNGKMRIQGPSEHQYSVNAPKTTTSYHSSVNLRSASYQPRMALLPSSSFPPHPPNNYPHSPQSLPLPHYAQSRQFKTPHDNQVPPLRHPVQSHSTQSFPTRRMPVSTSSNPSWEGRGSSGPFSEGLPSQNYTLSQRTYSQTSEGTLPEFLSLPESQQSANVPSYNSTDPLNGQSSVTTLENINETDSKFGVPIDESKSVGNKDPSITNLGQHHNPIQDLVSTLPSEIPLANSVRLPDTTGYPPGNQDTSGALFKAVPGDTKIGKDSPGKSSQDSDFISANTLSISNLSPNHHKINKPSVLPVFSSPAPTHPVSDAEPHHSDTTPSEGRDYEQRESPRKGGRQETFTKHTNSDSGLGEQTPEEISERIQRENHGPQTTSKDLESSRQPHYENDGHLPIGKDRIQEHEDPDLRHRSEHQGYFKDSPRGGYQNNQNYDSPRTQRPPQYEEGPGPDQRPMENYTGGYSHRDPSVPGQGHTQQPGGSYEDDESPRGVYQPSRGPGRSMGQGNHDHRYQEERYDPQGEHSSGFQESVNAWEEGRPHDGQDGGMDDARNTQKAMAYLQLSSDHAPSPKLYPRLPSSDSPSEASSSAVSSSNPEKQRIMSQMKEEQQARLDMEKIREELIKKAKSLQGKTIDRRKKARDYWKKRYYDEKKKTPGLEDQVAKLANQVQLQNRKLMSHLEGKGAKAPKGPPSKRMDHKIQIFKHQYDLDDVKRQVDNARMKLGTEIKLRTQAETELRILKSEVTQKKINVTLKRGKQLQAVQKSSGGKLTYQTPRPTGR
ncbi:uncharacterized protein [Apostichopus japonicus]|uniref:uncharacterized protein isoform X3 n=1 Tax=Stichopus japonicus TaxID=307972 RepID=UPI003AB49975